MSADVYLQKTSDYPVINAVWLNDVNDVMNTRYPMNLVQSKRYKVEAEISWGSSSAKRVILYQGDKSYDITAGASSLVLSDRFDLSKDLYIAATDQKNHTTVKKTEAGVRLCGNGGARRGKDRFRRFAEVHAARQHSGHRRRFPEARPVQRGAGQGGR